MTWHSLSFMPNNASCLCSSRSEVSGFAREHRLAAEPKIPSGCCKRGGKHTEQRNALTFWANPFKLQTLSRRDLYSHRTLAPWLQSAASPSVHWTSMVRTGAIYSVSRSASSRQYPFTQLGPSASVDDDPKWSMGATGSTDIVVSHSSCKETNMPPVLKLLACPCWKYFSKVLPIKYSVNY